MPETTPAISASELAKLVVEHGLATKREVDECRAILKEQSHDSNGSSQSLAGVLVAQGVVTKKQIERIQASDEPASSPNQQIPGYRILSKLGSGAMATVYKARQLSLDRLVAIKILPLKQTNNPQFVERFYYEGRAAAKLNHTNIVGALDVGKAGDFHYFVMEYVEGRTVYDDIVRLGKLPEADALSIVIQVTRALDHAHKAGFIHRDVKPKNIMITSEGVAKLADMGLARAVSDREAALAEQGKAFGTPYYISPEQIRGEVDVDFRADIYGLGATFYHMVTGQVPFDAANPSAVMHKHLKEELVPPDHINEALTAGIGEIIEVCMAKDRNKRYHSTADLLADLEAVARGEPPVQARKSFDLNSLAALEEKAAVPSKDEDGEDEHSQETVSLDSRSLVEQPMFWVAMGGWAVAMVLFLVLLVH